MSGGLQSTLYPFIVERPVFLREYANKAYSPFPYFMSKTIVELPLQVLMPMALAAMSYFATGLSQSADQFFFFMLVLMLGTACGTSMGFFIGCLFDSLSAALVLTNLFTTIPMIFNGMIRDFKDMPPYVGWISWISIYRYECESLTYNEFEPIKDDPDIPFYPVEFYDYKFGKWNCVWLMIAITVGFRALAFMAFRARIKGVQ